MRAASLRSGLHADQNLDNQLDDLRKYVAAAWLGRTG